MRDRPVIIAALIVFVGLLTFRLVIRPVLGYPGLIALLATFGLSIFIRNVVLFILGPNYRVINQSILAGKNFSLLGLHFSVAQVVSAVGCVLITYAVYLLIARTKFGRSLRATSLDKDTALLMGINTERVNALSFAIGSSLVGIAGAFLSEFARVRRIWLDAAKLGDVITSQRLFHKFIPLLNILKGDRLHAVWSLCFAILPLKEFLAGDRKLGIKDEVIHIFCQIADLGFRLGQFRLENFCRTTGDRLLSAGVAFQGLCLQFRIDRHGGLAVQSVAEILHLRRDHLVTFAGSVIQNIVDGLCTNDLAGRGNKGDLAEVFAHARQFLVHLIKFIQGIHFP